MCKHPKVLVVSHNCFSKNFNNGKTLESIFRNYPKGCIAQLYFHDIHKPDFDYCDTYYKVTDIDIVKKIFHPFGSCGGPVIKNKSDQENFKGKVNVVAKRAKFLNFFRDWIWFLNLWKTRCLKEWVLEYKPDYIFLVAGNYVFAHRIAMFLSCFLHIPLVIYFTDDYLLYPHKRGVLAFFQKLILKRYDRITVKRASLGFTIGDLMAEEYSRYFNKTFWPIINTVSQCPYTPLQKSEIIHMSYFGGLHLNRWQMIRKLGDLVQGMSEVKVEICIYSMNRPEHSVLNALEEVGVRYGGGLNDREVKEKIQESDVLLHIESCDKYIRNLTRLSVSTKIPEYLMAGRPVLAFGPTEVASMRILLDNRIGYVISGDDADETIARKLRTFLGDFHLRENLGKNAHQYAVHHFDNKKCAEEFEKKILTLFP